MNNRGSSSWEDGIITAFIALLALIVVIIAIVVYAICTELWKIYATRVFKPSVVRRFLLSSLAGLGVAVAFSLLLMAFPTTEVLGVYLLIWSFPAWVLATAGAEFYARHRTVEEPASELRINDILRPWEYEDSRRSA